jgi:hypothetical protein
MCTLKASKRKPRLGGLWVAFPLGLGSNIHERRENMMTLKIEKFGGWEGLGKKSSSEGEQRPSPVLTKAGMEDSIAPLPLCQTKYGILVKFEFQTNSKILV